MEINAARMEDGGLLLTTSDPEARRFVYGFRPGEYEIVRRRKRRSLDANAYAWKLISRLAETLGIPPIEVYRNAVRNVGGAFEVVCVREKAAETLMRGWEAHGLGWQAEKMPSKIRGCVNLMLWYGSSVYDARQMAQFIEGIIADCKAMDIETLPPEKLGGMLNEWR